MLRLYTFRTSSLEAMSVVRNAATGGFLELCFRSGAKCLRSMVGPIRFVSIISRIVSAVIVEAESSFMIPVANDKNRFKKKGGKSNEKQKKNKVKE